MAGKLSAFVTVHDENGVPHTFEPGKGVPDWAVEKITNPRVWDGKAPEVRKAETQGQPPTSPQPPSSAPAPADGEPPRAGAGSSSEAWFVYAAKLGITVPEGAGRDDVIKLVDEKKAAQA